MGQVSGISIHGIGRHPLRVPVCGAESCGFDLVEDPMPCDISSDSVDDKLICFLLPILQDAGLEMTVDR